MQFTPQTPHTVQCSSSQRCSALPKPRELREERAEGQNALKGAVCRDSRLEEPLMETWKQALGWNCCCYSPGSHCCWTAGITFAGYMTVAISLKNTIFLRNDINPILTQTILVLRDTPAVCAATPQGSADLDCTQNYHTPNLRIRSSYYFC